jgi:hypothetical protein
MSAEFFMDLCFIRRHEEGGGPFAVVVEQQLDPLFAGQATWYMESKQDEKVDIVLVELKGMGSWKKEEELVAYIEEHASDSFLGWIQGYRIELDVKEKHDGCINCGKKDMRLGVS